MPERLPLQPLLRALKHPEVLVSYSGAQWDQLMRLARAGDLVSRVAALARQHGIWDDLLPAARRHLRAAELLCQRQHTELSYEAQEIALALKGLPGPVVVLKGAAYVLSGLNAGRGRMLGDVDVLVPRAQLADAESALMLAGWMSSSSDYDQRYYRQWMHELPPMTHIKRGTVLDVHHAILPSTARLSPPTASLMQQIVPTGHVSGLWMLGPADMVLHSAVHLMHEGELEMGLRGLVDLDALLSEFGPRSGFWPSLLARARELNLGRPLHHVCWLLQEFLGSAIPEDFLQGLSQVPGARPGAVSSALTGWALRLAMVPRHPEADVVWSPLARQLIYLRGHWMRMPAHLLAAHLGRKAWIAATQGWREARAQKETARRP